MHLIACRETVFFTGAAGCGKSYLLRTLRQVLLADDLHISAGSYYFVAPTGVAACNIQGITLNSWAGVGLTNKPHEQLLAEISRNKDAVKRWKNTEILIIDEISLLSIHTNLNSTKRTNHVENMEHSLVSGETFLRREAESEAIQT